MNYSGFCLVQPTTRFFQEKKVHIWDLNLYNFDLRNLSHYPEGDIGAACFACRHFGHKDYTGCLEDYRGKGFDQLSMLLTIKNNPEDRRILIDLWDPSMMDKVVLMPCFMIYNFNVDTVNKNLIGSHIRSSDSFLGLPWNIGYAALMVHPLVILMELI